VAFRSYVLRRAVLADPTIESVADLARATSIKPGVFSKWFSGTEQPSVTSLKKLAPVIKAPLRDLLILAHRVRPEDLGMEAAPEPPKVVGHPLARELDTLLADTSPLPESERRSITAFLDQYLEPYRRVARMRSRGRRNTA
jgi:transcriptional regulator with XRE-family HTH domain